MKRHFDASRLYNLLKITVIVITIIAGSITVPLYLHPYDLSYGLGLCDKDAPGNNTSGFNDPNFKYYQNLYIECAATMNRLDAEYQREFEIALTTTIFLPLLFFGGTLIYKYLFPINKK